MRLQGKEWKLKIHYDGGIAREGALDLYDAGDSFQGLARALNLTAHAFVHAGKTKKRADPVPGVGIYIQPSQHGSFKELVTLVFHEDIAAVIGASIIVPAFWDFVRWSWSATVGTPVEPETRYVKRLVQENEELATEMAAVLEPSLEHLQRPIKREREVEIDLLKPRGEKILSLNDATLAYVARREETDTQHDVIGNVTRYNVLSGYGRFYCDEFSKIIPFEISDDVTKAQERLLTQSMGEYTRGLDGKLQFSLKYIVSVSGEIKRAYIYSVSRIPSAITEDDD